MEYRDSISHRGGITPRTGDRAFHFQTRTPMNEPAGVQRPVPQGKPRQATPLQSSDEDVQARKTIASLKFYNRLGLFLSGLLLFLVGGWAAFSSISGAVISQGTIVVEGGTQAVQHLEGGIVTQIAVREGQFVKRGDVIVKLDSTKAQSRAKYLKAQIESTNAQLALIDEELSGLGELFAQGLSRKSQLLSTRRRRAEVSGRGDESRAQLRSVLDEIARATVRAPISGHVHQMAVRTIGGVVQAGQTMLLVIPTNGPLVVESTLEPRSINKVKVGQSALVRLASFDQRTTPELKGEVVLVSADLDKDRADAPAYYKVQTKIGQGQLARLADKQLRPGMPAEVFIQTESRSVLSYLLKPMLDQFARTLRE